MSIEERSVDVLAMEQERAGGHNGPHPAPHNTRPYERIALWACLLLALVVLPMV